MKENIPAEEKLLRLIRGGKNKPALSAAFGGPASKSKDSQASRQTALKLKSASFLKLPLNKILIFSLAAAFIFMTASFLYPLISTRTLKAALKLSSFAGKLPKVAIKEKRPLEDYLSSVRGKQVFKNITAGPETGRTTVAAEELSIKDLAVVGIIPDQVPQAVIEDRKNMKTYTVTKGQYIGDFLVETIGDGKITLNLKGQRYELSI